MLGDWGLGIGDWGLGPLTNPQSPIPNPQSPIPNPHLKFGSILYINYTIYFYFKLILLSINFINN